jgi:invasion protein IalB
MASPAYLVAIVGLAIGALLTPVSAQTPSAPPLASTEPLQPLDLAPPAETRQPPEPDMPEWVVTCAPGSDPAKTTCQMTQVLFAEQSGQPIVSAVIRRQAEDRRMGMLLTLPHGLYFPPGLTITIDHGEATNVAIQTSDQNGAYAALPLSDELITAMKLGKSLNVAMRFADGRDMVVPLTLSGFTAALEKLTSLL